MSRSRKGASSLVVGAGLLLVFLLLGNGRIGGGDGETMFQVTRAMVEHGRLDLPPGILAPAQNVTGVGPDQWIAFTATGRGGSTYAKYGLGQSLIAVPFYGLGVGLRAWMGVADGPRLVASGLNALLTALTAGLLVVLARDLGWPDRVGVLLGLTFALATPAWAYTHTFFSEPLVALLLVTAAIGALRFSQRGHTHWLALSGGALGLAVLTRIDALAALPGFALYLGLAWRQRRTRLPDVLRQAWWGLLPFCAGIVLALAYNWIRFGRLLEFGYQTANWKTPFLRGLYGLTLSPGKGLLWYAPPVWLGLAGSLAFSRRSPREAVLCAGIGLGYLLSHSPYTYWEGGWAWGPRLILPAVPLLLLPAGCLFQPAGRSRLAELAVALVLVVGVLTQVPAVAADEARYLQAAFLASPDDFHESVLFRPASSPLFGQWKSLVAVTANLRDPAARAHLKTLAAQARPTSAETGLAETVEEARILVQLRFLTMNLPDLWLVTRPWLSASRVP